MGQILQTQTISGVLTPAWVNKAGLFNATEISYDASASGLAATNVKEAIDELSTASNNVNLVDNTDGTYTFTRADGTTVTITDTSVSTLTDNGDGNYSYTDETGAVQIINTNGTTLSNLITGNRVATVSEANGTSVDINETITDISGTLTTGNQIGLYAKEDGTTVSIKETISTLTDIGDGTYNYTDETGAVQLIDTRASSNPFNPVASGLLATDVQGAIDEVNNNLNTLTIADVLSQMPTYL